MVGLCRKPVQEGRAENAGQHCETGLGGILFLNYGDFMLQLLCYYSSLLRICVFALLTVATAYASEPVVEIYNAEKMSIAEAYKDSMKLCEAKAAEVKVRCQKSAAQQRRDALKAASRERDVGLACPACGKVIRVEAASREASGSVAGAVIGGVAGAVVGRQVASGGSSATKNAATAAGAVGGALIGNKVSAGGERQKVWLVSYQLYGGEASQKTYSSEPAFKVGDKIRADGERLLVR